MNDVKYLNENDYKILGKSIYNGYNNNDFEIIILDNKIWYIEVSSAYTMPNKLYDYIVQQMKKIYPNYKCI